MQTISRSRVVVAVFFVLLFAVGLLVYRDYGITWDETRDREIGMISYNYVFHGDQALLTFLDRFYGVAYETPAYMLERALGLTDSRDVYLMRHLLNFLVFYLAVIVFYHLCRDLFRDWRLGLLGAACLVLNPRIFANAFYNSKDLVFLSVFIAGIYTLTKWLEKMSPARTVCHALACAVAIDVRVVGVLLPAFTAAMLVLDRLDRGTRERLREDALQVALYLGLMIGTVVLLCPILWSDPVGNFIRCFRIFSNYPFDFTCLYLGSPVSPKKVPWHYIPVWIAITTPWLYLAGALVGLPALALSCVSPRGTAPIGRSRACLVLAWLLGPIAAVIVLHSTLYDGWRQMFFVYPALVIVAIAGLRLVYRLVETRRVLRSVLLAGVAVSLASTAAVMYAEHPYEHTYFSVLAGDRDLIRLRFDMDYWGISGLQALQRIVDQDPRPLIRVSGPWAGGESRELLPEPQRKRIAFVSDVRKADYFITHFRFHAEGYEYPEWQSLTAGGVTIATIYKLK